jgi:hypothetical protein
MLEKRRVNLKRTNITVNAFSTMIIERTKIQWHALLDQLVHTSEIQFLTADKRVVTQGERDIQAMYSIINGNCRVIVHEHNEISHRVEDSNVKRL